MSGTYTVFIEDTQFEVEGSYTPGDPGQTYGPPERCWQGYDSEFEIEHLRIVDGEHKLDVFSLPEAMRPDKLIEDIEQKVLEEIEND